MSRAVEQLLRALRLISWERRATALIVLCAVLAYATSLAGDFVFDDRHAVRDNQALMSLENVPAFFVDVGLFSSLDMHMYRPVLLTSYALNAAIFGMVPWIFKLTNLLVHIGCCVLVFQLGRRLSAPRTGALWAAAIFAVHPLASEAINTISGRSNLLMVFGLLLGMRFHLAAMAGKRWANLGTLVAGVIACGSKEPGIILPVLLLILEALRAVQGRSLDVRGACLRLLPTALLVGGYLLLRRHLLDLSTFTVTTLSHGVDVHTGYGRDMTTQLATMGLLLPRALLQFLIPWQPTMDPPVPYTDEWLSAPVLGGALLLGVLTCLALRAPRRHPALFVGTALAWGTALPWIIKPLNHPYLEHRLYGAIAGLSLVMACLLPRLLQVLHVTGTRAARVTRTLAVAVLVLFAVLTGQRSYEFHSEPYLWRQEYRRNPESILAMAGLAVFHMEEGRFAESRDLLRKLLAIYPQHLMARRNLAQSELKLGPDGSPAEAVRQARLLVAEDPKNPVYRVLLAQALTALGRRTGERRHFDEAVATALHCLEIAAPKGLVYITAAYARAEQGDLAAGLALLDTSVDRGLDHWSVLIYRAELLTRMGRRAAAARDLRRAQTKDPFAPQVLQAMRRFQAGTLGN